MSVLKETLWAVSGRAVVDDDWLTGIIRNTTSQTEDQTHNGSDASYDARGGSGDGLVAPTGELALTWTKTTSVAGAIDLVRVSLRASKATAGFGGAATLHPYLGGKVGTGVALDSTPRTLTWDFATLGRSRG